MSSKRDEGGTLTALTLPGKQWSLAGRLALWYAASSFAIVLFATLFLYTTLTKHLNDEHDQFLTDKVEILHRFLIRHPLASPEVRVEVERAFPSLKSTRAFSRLLSEDGKMAFETQGMTENLPPRLFPAPLEAETKTQGITKVQSLSGKPFRVLVVKHPVCYDTGQSCIIQIAIDHSRETELLWGHRKRLAIVLLASLFVCTLVGYRIAHRGIAPVRKITQAAEQVGSKTLHERIRIEGLPSELFLLAATFNKMLDRLENSFLRLTQFSADIAHELRTPISNLRGETEVALLQPRSSEEYQALLGSCLEEYSRLSRLIDSLLFLARTEHPNTRIQLEPVPIVAALEKMNDFYGAAANESGIEISVLPPTNSREMVANLDRVLFKRAVANLVSNAIRHTSAGGRVTISARATASDLLIEVIDNGCGIAPDHLPHIFNRFYRVDSSRSAHCENLGLGLALTKRIAELHGGTSGIESEPGKGTRAFLHFPGAII